MHVAEGDGNRASCGPIKKLKFLLDQSIAYQLWI